MRFIDLTGQCFGSWTAVRHHGMRKGSTYWWCRCVCGVERAVNGGTLRDGRSTSCGCRKNVTHGLTDADEYQLWYRMQRRCNESSSYVRRGITVDPIWLGDAGCARFVHYVRESLGPRPSTEHSLDRIDNSEGYKPGNLRWATPNEQARNRSDNRLITFRGETLCLSEWAERLGMDDSALAVRMSRCGWSQERALTTQPRPSQRLIEFNGETHPMKVWAQKVGISHAALRLRLTTHGWSVERALTTPQRTVRR